MSTMKIKVPNVRRDRTRFDRLTPDSTSAKYITTIVAPYGPLDDIEFVSFMYPHPEVAKEWGIEPFDVLDRLDAFVRENISEPTDLAMWQEVYNYYAWMRGKNFNDSENYQARFPGNIKHNKADAPKHKLNIPYFHSDGSLSSGFASFSIGGIHGAEAHVKLCNTLNEQARTEADRIADLVNRVRAEFPDATAMRELCGRQEVLDDDGNPVLNDKGKPVLVKDLPMLDETGTPLTKPGPAKTIEVPVDQVPQAEENTTVEVQDTFDQWVPVDSTNAMVVAADGEVIEDITAANLDHVLVITDGLDKPTKAIIDVQDDGSTWTALDPTTMQTMVTKVTMAVVKIQTISVPVKRSTNFIRLSDGTFVAHKDVLATGSTIKSGCAYKDTSFVPITVFKDNPDGSNTFQRKFTFTSIGEVIHQDFSSYYPSMLSNMRAFYNPDLGEDRYHLLYLEKEALGEQLSTDTTLTREQRVSMKRRQNAIKLLLNAASGAGDMEKGKSNIRMNNTILSMRLIGQMFSFRIGLAQTLSGGTIVSTNTDGLYSTLDLATAQMILDQQGKDIGVKIKPEPMLLVSKDSNNRLELKRTGDQPWQTEILGASGGLLACWDGPTPDRSLAHPAIIDYILVEYLRAIAGGYTPPWRDTPLSIEETFDLQMGANIIGRAQATMPAVKQALMFQNVLSGSPNSMTYHFATDISDVGDGDEQDDDETDVTDDGVVVVKKTRDRKLTPIELDTVLSGLNPRSLGRFNRVFMVKPDTPGAVNLRTAGAYKVNEKSRDKRLANGDAPRQISTVARDILAANSLSTIASQIEAGMKEIPADNDIQVRKINGVDPAQPMLIVNDDLHVLNRDGRLEQILSHLDLVTYIKTAAATFDKNWRNLPV